MKNILTTNPSLILIFIVLIGFMLILDLGVLNKKSHIISNKEALSWTVVWISLSMLFSSLIWWQAGFEKFAQFQSAYWIEKALSVDNLFVFILVFTFFKLEGKLQQCVLLWGILGALVFRAIFIFSGVELINLTYLPAFDFAGMHFSISNTSQEHADFATKTFFRPNLILTVFGVFLIYAGIKSGFSSEKEENEKDYNTGFGVRLIRKIIPISKNYYGDHFFIRRGKIWFATRLLLVMVVIESTDLIFAVDSIPAIFAIAPDDPFILYSSNIFAILGLRSMYFLLANSIDLFSKLKYGLAIILTFIGLKMLLAPFFHLSSIFSLLLVFGILLISIIWSVLSKKALK